MRNSRLFKKFSTSVVLLFLCALTVTAQLPANETKLLPDEVGNFTARSAPRSSPATLGSATHEDFDITSSSEREYVSASGAKFNVGVFKTKTNSAAYSLLQHLSKSSTLARASIINGLGVLGINTSERLRFIKGTTLVDIFGLNQQAKDAATLIAFARPFAESLAGEAGEVPTLVLHLPQWETVHERTGYAVSLPALQAAAGQEPALETISFDGGAEAVTATYGDSRLVIVEFTTPQYAGDNDARITERIAQLRAAGEGVPSAYKRVGNYSVFVFDAPNEQAAQQLLSGVKYEKEVRWLGDNPHAFERAARNYGTTMGGAILASLKITGLSLIFSLSIGAIVGGVVFVMRRRAQTLAGDSYSDAGGMLRLNLDDLKTQRDPARLLGRGDG